MMDISNTMGITDDIIIEAINEYGISEFWVGYSTGKDSVTLAHYMSENWPEFFKGLVFADTGIAVPDVIIFAKEYCKKMGWELKIVNAIKDYDDLVRKNGFPHVASHTIEMRILKMIPVRKFILRERMPIGSGIGVCVLLGVRTDESHRRKIILKSPFYKDGRMLYVSPILHWTNEEVYKYYILHKLERSPAYETIHISGDCLCGAFADKDEMRMLEIFYPDVANRLKGLEQELFMEYNQLVIKMKNHPLYGKKVVMSRTYTKKSYIEMQQMKKRESILIRFGKWGANSYQQTKKKKVQTKEEMISCSDCFFDNSQTQK